MCRRSVFVLCALAAACSRTPPSPEFPPGAEEQITGRESIGWDQRAADAAELATFRYAIYVDGNRSELAGVTCVASSSGTYACSARLPSLSVGRHAVQIASFIVDGTLLESGRSTTLNLIVSAATSTASAAAAPRIEWPPDPIVTSDGLELHIEMVAPDLDRPTGLAFLPDRRVVVAEQPGTIRVVGGGRVAPGESRVDDVSGGDGGLLAIALDPQFAENRLVYVLYTARAREDASVFRLARLREARGTFADRVVVHDEPRDAPGTTAALTVGPDGKLYIAAGGQVLRLNRDGTTPDDQPGHSPVYSAGYQSARGLAWQPQSGLLWVLDGAMAAARVMAAGQPQTARALPPSTPPSSIAFGSNATDAFRHDLLIASEEGRHLLRVRFDPRAPSTIVATERLLQDAVGGIRVVAAAPDGALYFATSDTIGRLVTVSRK